MTVPVTEHANRERRKWHPTTVEEVVQTVTKYHVDITQWGHKSPEDLLEEIFKGESEMTIENDKLYRNTRPIIIVVTFDRILPDGKTKERLYLHEVQRVQLDDSGNPTGELKPRNPLLPGSLAEKMTNIDRSTDDAARRALSEELRITPTYHAGHLTYNGIVQTSVPAEKAPVYSGIGIHRSTSFYTYDMLPSQFHPNGFLRYPPETKIPPGEYAYAEKDMQSKTLTLWSWSTTHPRRGT